MPNGQKQFNEACRKIPGGEKEVASVLGVSLTFVKMLRSGDREPGLRMALMIQRAFGIAVEAWVEPIRSHQVKAVR